MTQNLKDFDQLIEASVNERAPQIKQGTLKVYKTSRSKSAIHWRTVGRNDLNIKQKIARVVLCALHSTSGIDKHTRDNETILLLEPYDF